MRYGRKRRTRTHSKRSRGASMVEYTLLVSMISVIALAAVRTLGLAVLDATCKGAMAAGGHRFWGTVGYEAGCWVCG